MSRIGFLLVLATLAGCAQGFDRSLIHARLQDESFQVTDGEIEKAMALKPQLVFPCRIAVYCQDRWTAKEKRMMESWGAALKAEGIASDVFFLSDMVLPKEKGLKELRLAAAQHGADAVLVVHGASQVDGYFNPAAVLNLTIVGGFVVPASHCDALYVLQGALVDVGNGFLYASAESEGQGRIVRPTFLVEEKDAVVKAKHQAIESFGLEFVQRMRNLKASHSPGGLSAK